MCYHMIIENIGEISARGGRAITHELLNLESKVRYRWTHLLVTNSLTYIMTSNRDL
jgi:hypothetical protein